MLAQSPRRAANDMTASRQIALLERSVDQMFEELYGADEHRKVALMTLIAGHQRRIFELMRGAA